MACFYTLPRGKKSITGPSVRLAEIAVSTYGNLRAGTRILSTVASGDNPHVVIQAAAHDLEKNVCVTIEKRRRIVGKKLWEHGEAVGNKAPDEDDINLAVNAASAVAFRDAVFKVIPGALVKPVYEQAKKVAIGDATTLAQRRIEWIEFYAKMGVGKERILKRFSKANIDDIGFSELEVMIGLHNAIRDGDTTIDESFPEDAGPKIVIVDKPDDTKAEAESGLAPVGKPKDKPESKSATKGAMTSRDELRVLVESVGYTIDDFKRLADKEQFFNDPDSIGSWDEVPSDVAKRIMRNRLGIIQGLEQLKGEAQ